MIEIRSESSYVSILFGHREVLSFAGSYKNDGPRELFASLADELIATGETRYRAIYNPNVNRIRFAGNKNITSQGQFLFEEFKLQTNTN